jgi:hypothetical protein
MVLKKLQRGFMNMQNFKLILLTVLIMGVSACLASDSKSDPEVPPVNSFGAPHTRDFSRAEFLSTSRTPAGFLSAINLSNLNQGTKSVVDELKAKFGDRLDHPSVKQYVQKLIEAESRLSKRLQRLPSLHVAATDSVCVAQQKKIDELRSVIGMQIHCLPYLSSVRRPGGWD